MKEHIKLRKIYVISRNGLKSENVRLDCWILLFQIRVVSTDGFDDVIS